MKGKWGQEPPWTHDMRQLESTVRDALAEKGFTPARREGREGWDHVVQTGFKTFIEGPDMISVSWIAAYNHVLSPNDARERRLAMGHALAEGGFDTEISSGSSEVRVRRR